MKTTERTRRLFGGLGAVHSVRGAAILTGVQRFHRRYLIWDEDAEGDLVRKGSVRGRPRARKHSCRFQGGDTGSHWSDASELTRGPHSEFAAQMAPWSLVKPSHPVRLTARCVPTVAAAESVLRR